MRRSRVLVAAFLSDLNATVLGMPFALFPAINAERFGGSPRTLGLLTSAVAVGGLVGSGLSGPLRHLTRLGRAMLVASAVWGLALAGFGLAHPLWLALLLLAVAGTADVLSVICRSTIVQNVTPDRYRGRVNAVDFVVGAACPQLGNFRAGAVGSLTTPAVSAVGGGLAVVLGAVVIRLAMPALNRYDNAGARANTGPGSGELSKAADGAAGELRGVQVGVEAGRVRRDVAHERGVEARDGTGDGDDGGRDRGRDQRDHDRTVDTERRLVDVPEGGLHADPRERVVHLGTARPDEGHRAPGRVTDGRTVRHRNLLVAGEERLLGTGVLQQAEHVGRVVQLGQLTADRTARELLGVQVQVEAGRVGPDGVRDGRVADRQHTGRGGRGLRHRSSEQRYLHVTVHARDALVDVAERGSADALPGEGERDAVALYPNQTGGAALRVADRRLARHLHLVGAGELGLQEQRLEPGPVDVGVDVRRLGGRGRHVHPGHVHAGHVHVHSRHRGGGRRRRRATVQGRGHRCGRGRLSRDAADQSGAQQESRHEETDSHGVSVLSGAMPCDVLGNAMDTVGRLGRFKNLERFQN